MPPPNIVNNLPLPTRLLLPLIEAFAGQAASTPSRTAVICGSDNVTFLELDQRSARLARTLISRGIGKNDFVGIGLPRSLDLIVAILGILKAGAAYIPIDPSYPAARIAHMTGSSGLKLVVTNPENKAAFAGTEILDLHSLDQDGGQPLPSAGHADDFIYAIFTSGSTGAAKAASVFHRGFRNLVDWYVTELGLNPSDTTLVISSPSFDLTQKNFFAPLVTGGTLVLDEGGNYDIHRISSLIRDHRVTLINCTPSAFYPLVDAAAAGGFSDLSSLRFAVLGGEPISIPRLRGWLGHDSCNAEVVNSYGPTECTDICAFHRLNRGNLDAYPFVPTGREIPNVAVTIRDENLALLPAGELGELCIEGIGLGGGYLNDPQRTADRFVGPLYRTGDLAKRLPDGVIEFRGRADHQVKVNGFRIELGEIEVALSTHSSVIEAVVTAGDNRLTAHVQGQSSAAILREHLASILPTYMVPGDFRFVEKFPLTPNGKIDRAALQNPIGPSPGPNLTDAGSIESRLLSLWSEILERPVTDPSANFFDLGGTSIHLAIVHVRLREMTGRDLSITDLFANPSARSLGAFLTPAAGRADTSPSRDRARLQQAGFSGFRRPTPR